MHLSCLLPDASALRCDQVMIRQDVIVIAVSSANPSARCPHCGAVSTRIHSHYERTLADLPWQGQRVQMRWHSRKFFCDATECPQRIFTERLPEVAATCARRTVRLDDAQRHIAFACGGEAGARLAGKLGMPTSADSLLRVIRRTSTEEFSTPRVLGVDDCAMRRGRRYGTILCDLERHRPIDLLPERSSAAFSSWLIAHPGIEIISRDRGDDYTTGAAAGAPEATQVADRWHLVHNLHEVLVRIADQHHSEVSKAAKIAQAVNQADPDESTTASTAPSPVAPVKLTQAEQRKQMHRDRRRQRYERVMELHRRGMSMRAIARELGMHRRTVRRFVNAGSFPERAIRPSHSQMDPFAGYLRRRWDEGCHNAAQLTREIQALGFTGCYDLARRRVAGWRDPQDADHTRGPKASTSPPSAKVKRPSSTRVAWLLLKETDELEPEEQVLRKAILECCAELETSTVLAHKFGEMLRERRAHDLQAWISLASDQATPSDLCRFAAGLTADLAAVQAALSVPWSNGQVEGQINRLKLVKRQMYGRANFDLLRSRFLYAG